MAGLAKTVEVTGVKDHTGMTSIVMLRFKECVNKFYSDKEKISVHKEKESEKSINVGVPQLNRFQINTFFRSIILKVALFKHIVLFTD